MKCDKAQEFFSDYIENTLDRPMTVALESHLGGCESCRADVASLRSMWTVLDQVPQVEPPADFVWQVTSRLQNEHLNRKEAERARPLPWWKRLTPVQSFSYSAIAALLAVGLAVRTVNPQALPNAITWGGSLLGNRAPEPPQFSVQAGAQGGAVVRIRAASELSGARIAFGYLSPYEGTLVGRINPTWGPQTLAANQEVPLAIRPGGAYAARFKLFTKDRGTFEKIVLLPGAPVANVSLQEGDPNYALLQVAARTGQILLVDAGLGRVNVDFNTLTPEQALQQILQQTKAQATPQSNGVLTITKQP
jgi:hypothetical protein